MLKAMLIGNLGNDPELRYSASGSPFLRFNLASNYRTRTPEGEWQDKTEWVRVTVTGQRAESLSQYLRKGSRVYVDGRLEARPWTDQQGQVRAGLEVMANEVQFMSSRADDAQPTTVQPGRPMPERVAVGAGAGRTPQRPTTDESDLGDLPF
jgi:single-strand DNA-binding protein